MLFSFANTIEQLTQSAHTKFRSNIKSKSDHLDTNHTRGTIENELKKARSGHFQKIPSPLDSADLVKLAFEIAKIVKLKFPSSFELFGKYQFSMLPISA